MMDSNKMLEIIDLVIKENIKENEAIKSCGTYTVQLTYSAVIENSLHQSACSLDVSTILRMSIPTLRLFIKEVIESMRSEAAGDEQR